MTSRSQRLILQGPAWLLSLALFALCFGLQGPAAAQAPDLAISQASLRLWPEYDDPGLLVIFSGSFTGTASFPQQVAFPIPAAARGIQATYIDADGNLLSQAWQTTDGKLIYTLPSPEFQIEFYIDRPPSTAQRELAYTFEAPYAIKSLEVAAQQPARSSAFSIAPQPSQSTQGSDGFTYYLIERGSTAAGEKIPLTIRYTKSDQGLSVAQAKVDTGQQPLSTASTTTTAPRRLQDWLPFFLIGVGVVALAAAGIYAYLLRRSQRELPAAPVRSREPGRPRTSPSAAPAPVPAKAAFCTQCGRPLNPDERFCARCGTLRRE